VNQGVDDSVAKSKLTILIIYLVILMYWWHRKLYCTVI